MEPRDWLTTKEALEILQVSQEGLRRLLELGAIRANRMPIRCPGTIGRVPGCTTIKYDRQSVDDFKARRMTQTEYLGECKAAGVHVTPYYVRLWMKKGILVHGRDFLGRASHRWFFPSAVDVAQTHNPQLRFSFALEKSPSHSPAPVHA